MNRKPGRGRPMKIIKKGPPNCYICGDTGLVKRAYVEPEVSLPKAGEMVACPRCREVEK